MMDNKELQLKILKKIIGEASYAPIFKPNPKYCVNKFAGLTPYISCKDLKNNRIAIRGCPIGHNKTYDSGYREIIIEYPDIENLINDNWILDNY